MDIQPITPGFGAAIHGVNLADLTDAQFAAIEAALYQYAVLKFPGQDLSDEAHVAFGARFGALQKKTNYARDKVRIAHDYIVDISNIDADNQIMAPSERQYRMSLGNRLWHSDGTFQQIPSMLSILYAQEVAPEDGETQFADCRAAYDALSDADKAAYEGLVVEHSLARSRERIGFADFNAGVADIRPPVHQVLVRQHEHTGRRSLYVGAHASHILGWDKAQGGALVDRLTDYCGEDRFVITNAWTPGDVLMWDNRCVLHRGRPYDDQKHRRVMQKVTVEDSAGSVDKAIKAGRQLQLEPA